MFSQDDEGQQGLVLAVVLGLIAFVVTLVIGIGLHRLNRGPQPAPPAAPAAAIVVAAPAPVSSAPLPAAAEPAPSPVITPSVSQASTQAAADAATVNVEQGVVRFYFASGKGDLAAGAGEALGDVVKAAKAGRTLVISGFHDATGDAAKNAALARQRAVAVRDALKAAGVPERQIELKKPEQLAAGGNNAEARRVEITLR
jgi:outer membrane protein OmpA-like peptidoglycan-associated protein